MGQIVIYVDQGVNGVTLLQTVKSLKRAVDTKLHPLKRMNAQQLLTQNWEDQTALLVVPEGRATCYRSSLDGLGSQRIHRYVSRGGCYLGFSGGASFAAECPESKVGLQLYPGQIRQHPPQVEGLRKTPISCQNESYTLPLKERYVFENPHSYSEVQVLANYTDMEGDPAAIVVCQVGKGVAFLSGFHIPSEGLFRDLLAKIDFKKI